jgi:phospholipid/cholesterol/gamma-HCH transport system substrate-binding protein
MITTRMRVQLVVFVLIAVAGIAYAGGAYAGLGRLFGIHGYVVKVQLADSGGIFVNGEVTYRGVTVGRIAALDLTPTGVEADIDMDSSAPAIPASSRAVVADRSAVGEQYIDLEPPNDDGPMLHDGSVIPQRQTSIPIAPQTLLVDLDRLAASVPTGSLRTVVDELGTAFQGEGPDLGKLLDAASSLTRTATQHLPQTTGLLADGRTVLATQQAEGDQLISFSGSLNQLADQLRTSDGDIRKLITEAPGVAQQVDSILRASGNGLGVVFANMLTTARITATRTKSLTQALVEYPIASAIGQSASPDGTGHLGFVLDFFDPMPCTKGYEGTTQRPGNAVSDTTPVNDNAYCALPAQTGVDVRGSNNAPFGGVPQEVSPPRSGTGSTGVSTVSPAGTVLPGTALTPVNLATLLGLTGQGK